jgi:hypothetical protein
VPVPTLPSVADQAEKLIELGATGPLAPDVLRKEAAALPAVRACSSSPDCGRRRSRHCCAAPGGPASSSRT